VGGFNVGLCCDTTTDENCQAGAYIHPFSSQSEPVLVVDPAHRHGDPTTGAYAEPKSAQV